MNIRRRGSGRAPHAAAAAPAAPAPGASPAFFGHDIPGSRRDPRPPTGLSRTAPPSAPRRSPKAPRAAAAPRAALLACALLAALAAPPLWANADLLADIDGAIEFHETKTRSQAHITFWRQVRAAIVAEAVPDALKQEFDQRVAGAKPGGRFYQLYMDVKAAFERILNPPAPTATISVSPEAIELGQTATLTWSATDSDTTTLDGVEVAHSGSQEVSPHVTTTYALQASNGGGTAYVTAELEVTPPRAQQSDQDAEVLTCTKSNRDGCRYWARWEDKSDLEIDEGGYLPPTDVEIRTSEGLWVAGVTGVTVEAPGWPAETTGVGAQTRVAGDIPSDWEPPGYIRIQGLLQGGSADTSQRYGENPFWWARQGTIQTDEPNTRKTKITVEVNTVDDNIVQADKTYPLQISSHPNEHGGSEKDTKRIVIKEDDLWMATVRVRGGHAGGRCLAWAACQQGPSPEEDRYTVRGGIEFGQPGYDPNAAVTGCLHDLWDRTSACTRSQGGSPKQLVIGTGGPLGRIHEAKEVSDDGKLYSLDEPKHVDNPNAHYAGVFSFVEVSAKCSGDACSGICPGGCRARKFTSNPYETVTFTESDLNVVLGGHQCLPGRKATLTLGLTFRSYPDAPQLPEMDWPSQDRIKFLPASIDWCK